MSRANLVHRLPLRVSLRRFFEIELPTPERERSAQLDHHARTRVPGLVVCSCQRQPFKMSPPAVPEAQE